MLWGLFAAIGALLPPYHLHNFLRVILIAAFLLFLGLYFLKSRFAWHVIAIAVVAITPLYVLFTPPDAGLKLELPNLLWFHVAFFCIGVLLVLWSRKRYFTYLEDQKVLRGLDNHCS